MVNALEVNPNELIEIAAKQLEDQKLVQPPAWSGYVKTGTHTERPPTNENWWYMRAAAVLRSTYKLGPVGTSKLRTKYGGKKNLGYQPERFYKGSGAIIRKVFQQLEKAEFITQTKTGQRKGRIITPKGKSFLDKIAVQLIKKLPKKVKTEVKEEVKDIPKPSKNNE